MTKAVFFWQDMRHLLKNKKKAHTMVNNQRSPIKQVEENNKQYTAHALR